MIVSRRDWAKYLVTAIANGAVTETASRAAHVPGFSRDVCRFVDAIECMTRMMTVLVLGMAREAQVKIFTITAGDECSLWQYCCKLAPPASRH